MSIEDIKLKRFAAKFGNRPPKRRVEAPIEESSVEPEDAPVVEEGEEASQTAPFVKHCVAAIASKDENLKKLKQKGVSPFAICNASYNRNKRSLAATHSGGQHHTVAQYERALKKLREDTDKAREDRQDRSQIVFNADPNTPRLGDRRTISFNPE